MSDSVRPHRWQPTRLPRPWDFPGKNTGVGCHFLLQVGLKKHQYICVSFAVSHMGRVVGGGFRIGNSCTSVADSCQCMAKPIQYCKVKKIIKELSTSRVHSCDRVLWHYSIWDCQGSVFADVSEGLRQDLLRESHLGDLLLSKKNY